MRILLDECVDERLRHLFTEYNGQTARYAGFAGLTNEALLFGCRIGCFRCAHDGRSEHPEPANSDRPTISVLVLCDRTNRLSDVNPLVPAARDALVSMRPGQVVRVRK